MAHVFDGKLYFTRDHMQGDFIPKNHLKERLLDQAQAWALYTPPFWGLFA